MQLKKINLAMILIASLLTTPAHALSVNQTAPDFTLKSFTGKNIRLAEHRGKIILLNFWATWCTPCRQEIPKLNKLHAKYSRLGASVWGVNIDKNYKSAKSMSNQLNIVYPILHDVDQSTSKHYDLNTMPFTILIDRNGKVRNIYHGYRPGYEKKYAADINKLLRE